MKKYLMETFLNNAIDSETLEEAKTWAKATATVLDMVENTNVTLKVETSTSNITHKIEGIKFIRELTAMGLKEAKDLVEGTTTLSGLSHEIAKKLKNKLTDLGNKVRLE